MSARNLMNAVTAFPSSLLPQESRKQSGHLGLVEAAEATSVFVARTHIPVVGVPIEHLVSLPNLDQVLNTRNQVLVIHAQEYEFNFDRCHTKLVSSPDRNGG